MIYTGIGSRETPREIGVIMTAFAKEASAQGIILRSGAAPGADTFFEIGAREDLREIYLPWKGFNGNSSPLFNVSYDTPEREKEIARRFHPAWRNLTPAGKKLMVRNVYQVLGKDLETPSDFLVCWAKTKKMDKNGGVLDVNGGTGLAVRLAVYYGIPVYNLEITAHREFIIEKIKSKNFTIF